MQYTLKAYSIFEFGKRKDINGNPHQEDCIFPAYGKATDADRLFILCDGMGGHAAGEVASQTVCEAMSKTILNAQEPFSDSLFERALSAAYDLLDERDNSTEDGKKMGTTLTFLMLHDDGATIAHIGDSRVYHFRPATQSYIVHHTEDHSFVNDLVRIGRITPEQAKNHPQRNVITRAMQPHQEERCQAEIYLDTDIAAGDYFYLCSDGMLEQTSDNNLINVICNPFRTDEEKVQMLRDLSADNNDNHSAHLIHILELDGQPAHYVAQNATPPTPNNADVEPEATVNQTPMANAPSTHEMQPPATDLDSADPQTLAPPVENNMSSCPKNKRKLHLVLIAAVVAVITIVVLGLVKFFPTIFNVVKK